MEDFEYGACFSLWFERPLTTQEKSLLKDYQIYLQHFKKGYSFLYEFKVPIITRYEKGQLLKTIGFSPTEELSICGFATPIFRSIEAILKYFGGYAQIGPGHSPSVNGTCYLLYNSNKDFPNLRGRKCYLIDWEKVANIYNLYDPPELRNIYSIQMFLNKES